MLVIWLYFALQRQKYLELLEAKNLELETAAKQALAASEAKSSFLSRMSHGIRTPLNAILGFTRLALQPEKQSRRTEYLQKISYSSELLPGIVNDVLDMSAIENQKLKLDNSPFKLSQVLRELQGLYSIRCREKNISFSLNSEALQTRYPARRQPASAAGSKQSAVKRRRNTRCRRRTDHA